MNEQNEEQKAVLQNTLVVHLTELEIHRLREYQWYSEG
jgi:hypothetical protein